MKYQEQNKEVKMTLKSSSSLFTLVFGVLAVSLSACGGQAYNTQTAPKNLGTGAVTQTPTPTATPTTTPTTTTPTGTSPAISKSFTLQGTRGTPANSTLTPNHPASVTFENINADSRLVVDLVADTNSRMVRAQIIGSSSYAGATIYSSCLQVKVRLIDHNTRAQIGSDQLISVSLGNGSTNTSTSTCGGITAKPSVDFSGQLTAGHGPIDITISEASSVIYYNSAAGGYLYNQGLGLLYYTYSQFGSIAIRTDTTL